VFFGSENDAKFIRKEIVYNRIKGGGNEERGRNIFCSSCRSEGMDCFLYRRCIDETCFCGNLAEGF
jgi:hypothetical protein